MSLKSMAYNKIRTFAQKLGLSVQDGPERKPIAGLSARDMMTIKLSNMVTTQFSLPVSGDNQRALWLDGLADGFARDRLSMAIKKAYDTGDCIIVPAWNGANIESLVIDGDSFAITAANGDTITQLVYRADSVTIKMTLYELMVSISLVDGTNVYRAYVAKDGIADGTPLGVVPKWASYKPEWGIAGVDRLLIGRMKSPTYDDRDPNNVKGTPICYRSVVPMTEIDYLMRMLHDEMELSQKFLEMPKQYFKNVYHNVKGVDGTISRVPEAVLPKGKERVIMSTEGGGANLDAANQPFLYSPTIREANIINALEAQYRAFENTVGVSPGVLSKMNDANYSNVDNVRKTTINTQNFIDASRKKAESFLEDLVYSWDVLADYYNILPTGDYELSYNWSDEYINTFSDHMSMLVNGQTIGACDAVDYRMWAFKEPPDVAQVRVNEIAQSRGAEAVGV